MAQNLYLCTGGTGHGSLPTLTRVTQEYYSIILTEVRIRKQRLVLSIVKLDIM